MSFVKVANIDDLKSGEGKTVVANGREIALFNIDDKFYAIDNTCPHKGGPLGEGMLDGHVVTCPWHGWKFNVASGVSPVVSSVSVAKFDVKVEDGSIFVDVD